MKVPKLRTGSDVRSALTAAVILVTILGLAGILWQWDEAVKARDLASRGAIAEAAARREADARRIEAESSLATARKAVNDSKESIASFAEKRKGVYTGT